MNEPRDRPGLGRIIYSVDDSSSKANSPDENSGQAGVEAEVEITVADQESFPASDPPGFVGGAKADRD